MAFAATASTADPRAQSIGPKKMQVFTYSVGNGDTSGTITATNLYRVEQVVIDGVALTAAPTFATNVVTLAFADPGATRYGTAIVFGV